MKRFHLGLIALVIGLVPPPLAANDVRQKSLEQKVAESDVVAIGRVTSLHSRMIEGILVRYANVRVTDNLKGNKDQLYVVFRTGVSEDNPRCCRIGRRYLLFLHTGDAGDLMYSVNGPFGIYEIR